MSFDQWTQKQAHRLARIIALQHTDADHGACLDALDDYITAQLARENYTALFPSVVQHLDSCVGCAEAYALVYEARVADAANLAGIVVPEPDLGFLQQDPRALLGRRIAEAVEWASPRRLRFTLSQTLLDLLMQQPAPNLAFRSTASDVPLISMTLDQSGTAQIQIQVSIYGDRQSPELCTVRAQVSIGDREWPDLAEIPVTLTVDGSRREAITDPWGEVVFPNFPKAALSGLQIEVDGDSPPQTSA